MSSNYGFEPTLDGLNIIDADSTTTTDIICDNLTVNLSGTAPTMTGGDNSTHLATTAFVSNAISTIGSSYVTLTGTQTISGEKTFSNTNTYITGLATFSNGAQFNTVLPTSSVVPVSGTQLTNKTYVDSVSGGSALLTSTNTFTGTNTFNNSNNVFEATSIAANSATALNIATNTSRTHAINIGNGTNATCNISIGDLRSSVGTIKIGSGASSGNILVLDSAYIGIGVTTLTTNILDIGQANTTLTNYCPQSNSGLSYPITTTTANGYFNSTTTTTRMSVANVATDLATITVSVKGCYLVEGHYLFSGTSTNMNNGMLGLSTTSVTYDIKRKLVTTLSNLNTGNHITSVFNINSVPTTFYLIGNVGTSLGAGTLQDNYLAFTKIA